MSEWIIFIHPPRENFAETITEEEQEVWNRHFDRYQKMLEDGSLVVAGPTLGPTNTGVFIFEAPNEAAAREVLESDPIYESGYARCELRPFRVSLLRGRD